MTNKLIPLEELLRIKQQMDRLPARSKERQQLLIDSAAFYHLLVATLRRKLDILIKPKELRRKDYGNPRILDKSMLESYCELIAAFKLRSTNKKHRHIPTTEIIRLMEEHGIEKPAGLVQVPKGLLKKSTINRYLKRWELTQSALSIEPVAVRFQAEQSNDCWHFDMSPCKLTEKNY